MSAAPEQDLELHRALAELRRMRSPSRQVAAATALLDRLGGLEREVSGVRDVAVRRMRQEGCSFGAIAKVSGLTRSRVVQLLARAGAGA